MIDSAFTFALHGSDEYVPSALSCWQVLVSNTDAQLPRARMVVGVGAQLAVAGIMLGSQVRFACRCNVGVESISNVATR